MDKIKILKDVVGTLNLVSVAGVENMDRMLGCIQAIQQVRQEMEAEANAGSQSSDEQPETEK